MCKILARRFFELQFPVSVNPLGCAGYQGCSASSLPNLPNLPNNLWSVWYALPVSAAGLWLSKLPEAGLRNLRGLGKDVSFMLVYLVLQKGASACHDCFVTPNETKHNGALRVCYMHCVCVCVCVCFFLSVDFFFEGRLASWQFHCFAWPDEVFGDQCLLTCPAVPRIVHTGFIGRWFSVSLTKCVCVWGGIDDTVAGNILTLQYIQQKLGLDVHILQTTQTTQDAIARIHEFAYAPPMYTHTGNTEHNTRSRMNILSHISSPHESNGQLTPNSV